MKATIDGEVYIKIGEVCELIDRSPSTLRNWYEWAEENDVLHLLPDLQRVGTRRVRYYKQNELHLLLQFKQNMRYGAMSKYNRRNWGERGKDIKIDKYKGFKGLELEADQEDEEEKE